MKKTENEIINTHITDKIPTEEENNKLKKLFLAIYFNDLQKVIKFKKKYPEIYSKKEYFKIDEKKTFDLKNLTFFNHTIWKNDEWIDEIKPLITKILKKTEDMLNFWKKEYNDKNLKLEIEYNHYWDYFYCSDPNDPEENNTVILAPMEYFLNKGYREIDLKLYNRVACFDFEETKKLLEQGANPNIDFYEDEDSSTFNHIASENSYLCSCQVIPTFRHYENNNCKIEPYWINGITELFGDLLGVAAYEEMYHLLEKYDKEK